MPYAQTYGGTFLVSDDGRTLFVQDSGVSRIDRRTGRKVGPEVLRMAGFGAFPPRIASRTTSQGLNGVVGPSSSNPEPLLYAAARDFDHLLVASRTVITEIGFRDRGNQPNRNWSFDMAESLANLRYGPRGVIEAWIWRRKGRGSLLFDRFVGNLNHPESGMRRETTLQGRLPIGFDLGRVNVGGYDPETRTYVLGMAWGGKDPVLLVNLAGRIVRRAPHRDTTASAIPDAAIEWALRAPANAPGGRDAWEPLAFSGSRRYWLLPRKSDGRTFVFRR